MTEPQTTEVKVVFFCCPQVEWRFQAPRVLSGRKKNGLIVVKEADDSVNLSELDVRKSLMVSISRGSEHLRVCNVI